MLNVHAQRPYARPTALLLAASLLSPVLMGCGSKGPDTSNIPPPADATRGGTMAPAPMNSAPPQRTGMSTGKKVAIVAGAALLYYMYKKHQKNAEGQTIQYYKSEGNGRVYYRDPKTHQAIYVTPPSQQELDQLSPQDTQELSRYKGYNNQTTGEDYQYGTPDPSGSRM